MSEQASLHFCNLAGQYGCVKAREMLGIPHPGEEPKAPAPVVPPATTDAPPAGTSPAQESPASEPATPVSEAPAAPVAETPAAPTREQLDEGAKGATAAQLKEALTQLSIPFKPNAKKTDLLAAYLARP